MNYRLAALKLICAQLRSVVQSPPPDSSMNLFGILFQRVWLEGVLVSYEGKVQESQVESEIFHLDDGTGIVAISLSGDFRNRNWKTGMYVMVVGGYLMRTGQIPMVKVHKMVDLSAVPDRESMWYLEVMEAYKLFYQHSSEG